jgi:Lecithin retinol acyltransferase
MFYGNWFPGGVLRVYSPRHNVWHFGIASSVNGMVMHASKDIGEFTETTYEEFAQGQATEYTWRPENFQQQQEVLRRSESLLGRPFHLLNANCEDYVNWIVTGVAWSPQRDRAALVALLLLIILGGFGGLVRRA